MKNPKEVTDRWLEKQAKKLGLKIGYVKIGGGNGRNKRQP